MSQVAPQHRSLLRAPAQQLFVLGFCTLFWELVLIRWLGSCVRIVAYYSNFVLIAAFFGLGCGALLSARRLSHQTLIVPAIALNLLLGGALASFNHPNPQSRDEYIWIGAPFGVQLSQADPHDITLLVLLPTIFMSCLAIFVLLGSWTGRLLGTLHPLRAYSLEIAGSILGITCFGFLSWLGVGPVAWFAVGFAALLLLLEWRPWSNALALALVALVFQQTVPFAARFEWSPYYRIFVDPITQLYDKSTDQVTDYKSPVGYALTVNNDYHQMMLDLATRTSEHPFQAAWRSLYEAPYRESQALPAGPILVVGAGTGNDVAAALRRTNREIHAVEIDPKIAALGKRLHPEHPYANPRVHLHITDARSYFEHTQVRFALIVFGYLDSHTLLSAFSSLRLDNFVYTRESLAQARHLLVPGGRVALVFCTPAHWMHQRVIALMDDVFGQRTNVIAKFDAQPSYVYGVVYENRNQPGTANISPDPSVIIPTDDWPFLYLRQTSIPSQYLPFLLMLLLAAPLPLLMLSKGQRRMRWPYFFLGAAFFLIETSNVVQLSILYGSTWIVNTLVFTGILSLVLLGNLTAHRSRSHSLGRTFAWLACSLLLAFAVPTASVLWLDSAPLRALAAVCLFLGPVYFASTIFAQLIRDETNLAEAYGSNVLGAVVGGASEYLSLIFGFKFLLAFTMVFYVAAYLALQRERPQVTSWT